MPGDNRFRLDDPQRTPPIGPQARQEHPEGAVELVDQWPGVGALEHEDLLAQGEVSDEQIATGAEEVAQEAKQESDHVMVSAGIAVG